MTDNHINYNQGLQTLRFLAALLVVAAHIAHYMRIYYPEAYFLGESIERWGILGVDMFFVISGYLMTKIQSEKCKSALVFFLDRILRIVPLYWALTIIYSFGLLTLSKYNLFITEFSIEHLISSMFFLSTLFMDKAPFITVGWSLEFEILFYFFFSISIIFFKDITFIALFTAIIIILFFIYFGGPWHLGFEFVIGMFLGIKKFRDMLFILIALTTPFLYFLFAVGAYEVPRALYFGLPCAIIVYFVINYKSRQLYISTLGGFSYEIYLIQVFILPILFKLIYWLIPDKLSMNMIAFFGLLFVVASGYLLSIIFSKSCDLFWQSLDKKIGLRNVE